MTKWLPIILSVAGAAVTAVSPVVQGALAHHPTATAVIAAIWASVKYLLPSPVTSAQ